MSAAVKDRLFSSREAPVRRDRESWRDMMRRWMLRCPQCAQTWLVVGARVNDMHECKSCSHSFVIEGMRMTA